MSAFVYLILIPTCFSTGMCIQKLTFAFIHIYNVNMYIHTCGTEPHLGVPGSALRLPAALRAKAQEDDEVARPPDHGTAD